MEAALKYKIVEKIIQSEDDILLNEISSILGVTEGDFWIDLPKEIQKSINDAKTEFDRGEGIPHDEVMSDIKKRFLK